MTTVFEIEYPPEPPIGTVVGDKDGHEWTRSDEGWGHSGTMNRSWWFILTNYRPLTLVSLPRITYALPPEPEGPVWDADGNKWVKSTNGTWNNERNSFGWFWRDVLNLAPLTNYDPKGDTDAGS